MASSVNNGDANERPFVESSEERKRQIESTNRIFEAAAASSSSERKDVLIEQNHGRRVVRPLFDAEVNTLRGCCHCLCSDWSKLRLLLSSSQSNKDQSSLLERHVSHTTFSGVIVFGLMEQSEELDGSCPKEWRILPPGIHHNTIISNCVLEVHSRVHHNGLLSDTYVGAGAVLCNCSRVSRSGGLVYGQLELTVGPESGGGRRLTVTSESTMIDVCCSLGMSTKRSMSKRVNYRSPHCNWNILGASSVVRDTATIENIYLAPNSSITAASSVKNVVLLSHAEIGHGCTVSNVLLQWNASIRDNSSVSDTLLMEEAHAGPHSLVASSILGPDVHVSAGEVHASVLGPNTNAHHQSLVIGVLWPLGRGNVGYGANVGSNHTGRLPDQETIAGEGTFWGLSTVIKFPVDLSWAPYSLVAAGTNLPPQRITMPFSLLVETEGIGHIIPAWVLLNSPYTLSRSEAKFAERRKAKRHDFYTGWKIIRPDVVDMCVEARDALRRIDAPLTIYKTDKHVEGIGTNHLTEKARVTGIRGYTDCIRLYALRGLLDWILSEQRSPHELVIELQGYLNSNTMAEVSKSTAGNISWPRFPWGNEDHASLWRHQISTLRAEFPDDSDLMIWVAESLKKLVLLQVNYAERVYTCKRRDDVRGAKTIPGYRDSHVAVESDPVIKAVRADAINVAKRVDKLLESFAAETERARSRL